MNEFKYIASLGAEMKTYAKLYDIIVVRIALAKEEK